MKSIMTTRKKISNIIDILVITSSMKNLSELKRYFKPKFVN